MTGFASAIAVGILTESNTQFILLHGLVPTKTER